MFSPHVDAVGLWYMFVHGNPQFLSSFPWRLFFSPLWVKNLEFWGNPHVRKVIHIRVICYVHQPPSSCGAIPCFSTWPLLLPLSSRRAEWSLLVSNMGTSGALHASPLLVWGLVSFPQGSGRADLPSFHTHPWSLSYVIFPIILSYHKGLGFTWPMWDQVVSF